MSPCSIPNVPLVLLLVLAAQMRPLLWLVLAHAWKLLVGMSRCFQEPPSQRRDVFGLLQGWLLMPGTVASHETLVALKHRHKTRAPDGVFGCQRAPPSTGAAPVTLVAVEVTMQRLAIPQN